jgi:hypothetical protein
LASVLRVTGPASSSGVNAWAIDCGCTCRPGQIT